MARPRCTARVRASGSPRSIPPHRYDARARTTSRTASHSQRTESAPAPLEGGTDEDRDPNSEADPPFTPPAGPAAAPVALAPPPRPHTSDCAPALAAPGVGRPRPRGRRRSASERADLAPPAELLAAAGDADATAAAGDGAEGGGPGDTTAARSAKETASGLDPDLEALIEEEEKAERREAQASSSTSDGGSEDGAGANPFAAAVGSTPQVDHFTGGARLEVPIQIPPGRRDATPDLKLIYSSSAGDSPWGYGWDLPIGHISRSTKWGVPSCPLNETDAKADFVLNLNGSSLELKRMSAYPHNGSITHFYRARISESYLEVFAITGTRNYWEVFDRAGNKYVFGDVPAARLHSGVDIFYDTRYNTATGAHCNFTTQWMLTRFVSPNGNEIVYNYFKDVPGNPSIYLESIDYGGNGRSAKLREAPFRIAFDRTISLINRDRGTPLNDPNIHPSIPGPPGPARSPTPAASSSGTTTSRSASASSTAPVPDPSTT